MPHPLSPTKSPDVRLSMSPAENSVSAASHDLTIFVIQPNRSGCGPFLDPAKVTNLPEAFGPGPLHRVLRESVQQLVDAALDQKKVFELLRPRQGDGKVIITASFDNKMHKIR